MITCPRCGYQAPDGTPWCPNCGYGAPQQQMPVVYQQHQIPAQDDIYDLPPQQNKQPLRSKTKKKKKLPKWLRILLLILSAIALPFVVIVIWAIVDTIKNPPIIPTSTPTAESMESIVQKMMDQNATETMIAVLSATPTFTMVPTNTPVPTNTLAPTATPIPTNTVVVVSEPITPGSVSGAAGVLGSTVQDTDPNTCRIKGNVNSKGEKIYHCTNSPNYDDIKIHPGEGDRWFCSAEEAIAAGFRAPKNMSYCQP